MPINHYHQMNILKDILSNHQMDCCGTISECEQLERLVQSLLSNEKVDTQTKSVLSDIHTYSSTGLNSQQLDNHITSHQDQISQWIADIDQLS